MSHALFMFSYPLCFFKLFWIFFIARETFQKENEEWFTLIKYCFEFQWMLNCVDSRKWIHNLIFLYFPVKLMPLPMYGSLPSGEQLKVFRRTPNDSRKIVVATNIAETSITIANITYGKMKCVNKFVQNLHVCDENF